MTAVTGYVCSHCGQPVHESLVTTPEGMYHMGFAHDDASDAADCADSAGDRERRAVSACPRCGTFADYPGRVLWCACSGWIERGQE